MSLTYNQAVEQTITAGEQIHQIVNGTATTEVTVEDGSKVPSIRKALLDNFYFKDPIAWQVGQTENVFNQLRQFTDGSWWYAPSATASNQISMGSTPIGDPLWKIYDFDAIGKLEPRIDEALRRSYAEAGYNLVDGSFEAGGTLVNANDVLLQERTGKAFSGPAGAVAAGTNPASGGFVDKSGVATSASAISNANGGSVQDFIDDTESTLTKEGILSPFKNCSQLGKLLADGTPIVIACTGDSTMLGYDAITELQNVWNPPASLGIALNLLFGLSITPINYAISGTTLRQMLAGTNGYAVPFSEAVSAGVLASADIIYCNHGINDSQLNNSIDQYRADIIEYVRLCRINNKVPVLVTPNPNIVYATDYPNALINDTKTKRLLLYVEVMRDMAQRLNVDIVDQYYYFTKSFEQVNPKIVLPDGVHMSDLGYRQAGFNLAIPLISVNTLYKTGDSCGLSGSTYYDNATVNRMFQSTGSPRTGVTFSCSNPTSGFQGINYPFILDVPSKALSLIGLQWQSAGKCDLSVNHQQLPQILYQQKNYGNVSTLNWDAENKIRYQFLSGLNIISILHQIPNTGIGNDMAFAGVHLPPLVWEDVLPRDGYVAAPRQIGLYDSVFIDSVLFTDSGEGFKLIDSSSSNVLTIEKQLVGADSILKVKLWRDGVSVIETNLSAFSIPDNIYPVQIDILPQSVQVMVSGTSGSIAITEPLPSCYVGTPWKHFIVKPSIQI